MNRHLITIEIRIKSGTDKWVELDCLPLYEKGLKGLNTKTVQGWRPVEQDRMLLYHLVEHIPHLRPLLLDHLFRTLDSCRVTPLLELLVDKGFKELESHLFWDTALMELKVRPDNDNGTP